VLGENDLALRMVRDLGWAAQMRYHDGIARVVADLAPDTATPPSRSALMTAADRLCQNPRRIWFVDALPKGPTAILNRAIVAPAEPRLPLGLMRGVACQEHPIRQRSAKRTWWL